VPPPSQVDIGIVGRPVGFVVDLRSDEERAAGVSIGGQVIEPGPREVVVEAHRPDRE
jgi:hypothetical protein